MFTYSQKTGNLLLNGAFFGQGYSGHEEGKNNPAMQAMHDVGPIPCGQWLIVGPPCNTKAHGPYVLRLEPKPGTETFGRDGFLMHGDSVHAPGTASTGCIIMGRIIREAIWRSRDDDLEVVPDLEAGDKELVSA